MKHVLTVALVLACSVVANSEQITVTELKPLDPTKDVTATAISGDGATVVGSSNGRPFIWTAAGGMRDLGFVPGSTRTRARALSHDGSVALLDCELAPPPGGDWYYRPALWTASTGLQLISLPTNPALSSTFTSGMSGDGKVLVGTGHFSDQHYQAFRWTQADGFVFFDTNAIAAAATNFDGSVIVGQGFNRPGASPYIWRKGGGITNLTGQPDSMFYWISNDASTIIGESNGQWFGVKPNLSQTPIPVFDSSTPSASQDGSVVVDVSMWSKYGAVGSQDYLAARGITIAPSYWAGVSANGKHFIVTTCDAVPKSYLVTLEAIVPVTVPDKYSDYAGHPLVVPAPGVLENDAAGPNASAMLVTPPAHALAFHFNPDGSFSYQPQPGSFSADSFTYVARTRDGQVTNATTALIAIHR